LGGSSPCKFSSNIREVASEMWKYLSFNTAFAIGMYSSLPHRIPHISDTYLSFDHCIVKHYSLSCSW